MPIPRKIALLCLLLASATSAQASQSLSLPQALAAAFAQNPELAAAGREVGIADGERRQAGLIPNPELSWEVEDTRRDTSTTTVTLSQPLELGGKRGARIAVAGAGQAIAQLDLERQRNGLRADVVQAFHAALRAQTALELAQQSQALTERGLRVVQGRVTAGQSSPVEATRAQVQLAQAQAEVRRAQTQRGVAYQALARLTGSPLAGFDRLQAANLSPGVAPRADTLSTGSSKRSNGAWPPPRSSVVKPPWDRKRPSAFPTSPSASAASTAARTANASTWSVCRCPCHCSTATRAT